MTGQVNDKPSQFKWKIPPATFQNEIAQSKYDIGVPTFRMCKEGDGKLQTQGNQ